MPVPRAILTLCFATLSAAWAVAGQTPTPLAPLPEVDGRPASRPLLPVTLSSLEERLFADASDGVLDDHSLLAAALVAGGMDDAEAIDRYEERLDAVVDQWRESTTLSDSAKERAQAVFEFMHGRLLRGGYRLEATDLAIVLEKGQFNCVSASLLFCHLAGRCGLDARGLELPGHAMSRLHFGNETVEVESTCPRWFRLTADPRRRAELVEKTTGFRHDVHGPLTDCREVSGVALIATIYYNRGVDLLTQHRYAEAVESNTKALWLDPSSVTARGNLLATLNNWAIAEGAAGHFNEAVGLLRAGMTVEANFKTFHANFVHVHRQWIKALRRRGQFEQLCSVLSAAQRDLPDEPWFAEALLDAYHRWASTLLAAEQIDGAFTVLDAARRLGCDDARAARMEIDEVGRYAAWLAEQGRGSTALRVLDRALQRHPNASRLARSRRAILSEQGPAARGGAEPELGQSWGGEHFISDFSEETTSEGSGEGVSLL